MLTDEERKKRKNVRVIGWYNNHPGYNKEHAMKSKRKNVYKISEEDYARLLLSQNGKCAICGKDNNGRALCIDHDHKTGKVRGLLCDSCNWAIGQAHEDPVLLEKMAEYLKKSNADYIQKC